ncbi:hypothetical protein JJC03_04245 [Flavobacterium oreochromis]|uniref:hypothetical protein n=1 Tax=Flavobacterium oreochromis TaxID=2906078 RepID=UPI001CE5E2D4|nr:hypothetical protein [Flavobacterium oreochromis]QYS87164.1 hypothetical protein JJC03_04245 [Flavobacterium oreochromis]
MKKLAQFFFLFFFCCFFKQAGYSQFGYGKPMDYGKPSDFMTDAIRSSEAQSELQRRYDNNYSKISNAINNIRFKINQLQYDYEKKERIRGRFDKYVSSVNINGNTLLSNSQTNYVINDLYDAINSILREEN